MGSDRGLSTGLPVTVADPSALGAWLDRLPRVSAPDEVRAMVGAVMGRIGERSGVVPTALESVGHPVADMLPEELLALDLPGRIYERLLAPADRRAGGSHYTPYGVARSLVELALRHRGSTGADLLVADPAAGAGVFLLSAAEVMAPQGDRAEIVSRLWGFDIDQTALDLADAMLEIWCEGRARPHLHRIDVLVEPPPRPDRGFDLVVGNPPFLGQLAEDTARSSERRRRLGERFGAAASGYVDDAAVFLRAGSELLAPGGTLALIQPQSVLGAGHAEGVRAALEAELDLAALWVEHGPTFEAGVDVCAPVLVRRAPTESVEVMAGEGPSVTAPTPTTASWSPLLVAPRGVPMIELVGDGKLGDIASVTAGFRQHFYGLAEAVREDCSELSSVAPAPRLVTAGGIDLFDLGWGIRPVRFAGRRWHRPVVDLDRAEPKVADWFRARLRPKVLVASQTRVVEAVIDTEGDLLPSVPVISVEPDDVDVALVAAVLAAPPVTAHLAAVAAGTGLSADAIRVRAATLAGVPLPTDRAAWREGADHALSAQAAISAGDIDAHRDHLRRFGEAMTVAFGQPSMVMEWWWQRLRFRG